MKIFLSVISACFLWAIQNAVLEIKLSKSSPLTIMLITYATALPLGLVTLFVLKQTSNVPVFPTTEVLAWAVGSAVLFFIADFLFIGAYSLGGDSTSITILTLSIPVFVILIKCIWKGEVPSMYHLAAFVTACMTFFFVYLAEVKKT